MQEASHFKLNDLKRHLQKGRRTLHFTSIAFCDNFAHACAQEANPPLSTLRFFSLFVFPCLFAVVVGLLIKQCFQFNNFLASAGHVLVLNIHYNTNV